MWVKSKKIDKPEVIKDLHQLISTCELSKMLRISSEKHELVQENEQGRRESQIGNDKIELATKDRGWGSSAVVEMPFFRIHRIATEENCEFPHFVPLNDLLREYVLPPRKNSREQNKEELLISCTNKDANTSGTNPGGWHVGIKVVPKEFEDRWK